MIQMIKTIILQIDNETQNHLKSEKLLKLPTRHVTWWPLQEIPPTTVVTPVHLHWIYHSLVLVMGLYFLPNSTNICTLRR